MYVCTPVAIVFYVHRRYQVYLFGTRVANVKLDELAYSIALTDTCDVSAHTDV